MGGSIRSSQRRLRARAPPRRTSEGRSDAAPLSRSIDAATSSANSAEPPPSISLAGLCGVAPRHHRRRHILYPAPLLELKRWYAAEFGDYLMAQPPGFFLGLICLELAFQWPLAVATLYGILTRRRWAATTSLMDGVATLTSMSAGLGEMLGSGKATPKLIQMYAPFAVFAVIAILRGLCSCSGRTTASSSLGPSVRKKRVYNLDQR